MKHITVSLFCLMLILMMSPLREAAELYDEVIRVHILAQDDTEEAQGVKLLVRDRVLIEAEKLLAGCTDRAEAARVIEANTEHLARIADAVLRENGMDYGASVALGYEYYDRRDYEGFSLPAGTYHSLRISLGDAKGKNWWCVLFPTLCLRPAVTPAVMVDEGLSEVQADTVSTASGYTLRFRVLDWFAALWKR